MKQLLRELAPPILMKAVRRARTSPYGFFGDFATWAEAQAEAAGYEASGPVQAARGVQACLDVDARLQQLLAAIVLVPQRPLSVLDFGGAAGHYFDLLRPFLQLEWTVLETPAMVEANRHRSTGELRFISSIHDAAPHYDLVLMSGVLQYLEAPHQTFEAISGLAPWVLVNRLPLIDAPRDRLTVQRVDPSVYSGSYPAWFFARDRFMAMVEQRHDVAMRWDVPQDAPQLDGKVIVYRGLMLRAR